MTNFRPTDRLTSFLLPPSIDEWLPERHLARFVVEVIEGLDLTALSKSYRGTGSASYHPAPLLGLLVYGYATGVFSSRKLERATCPIFDMFLTKVVLYHIDGLFSRCRMALLLFMGCGAADQTMVRWVPPGLGERSSAA